MSGNFFANYKDFIIYPVEEKKGSQKEFNPKEYASHYILTLSLYDPLIANWEDASKYEIDIERSIEKVIEEFNDNQKGIYHIQVLELESDKSYFVLSLSCADKIEEQDAQDRITYVIERIISNPFYVGQSWFRLIGDKGRIIRKLFSFSFKEYTPEEETEKENTPEKEEVKA